MSKLDLNEWNICNPDLRQDVLPQPYRLISDILDETILHNLNLYMYQIEEKKKDENYQGSVKEYLSQNTINVENIACVSSNSKHHNHLLVGDKCGNVYLLDLAKKIVFSKKQLCPARRVLVISETTIGDGDVTITTVAVILNNHNKIYILRYKHSEQKLILAQQIEVATDESNPNKLPFNCQFDDYGRLLFVFTYEGNIILFRIPEVAIDLDEINKQQTIPLEEQEFKKKLRYPLNYAVLQNQVGKITDRFLEIRFEGKRLPQAKGQILTKMAKKAQPPPTEDLSKKDPKKKEQVKVEQQVKKEQIEANNQIVKAELLIENGSDNTPAYALPKFKPFLFVIHRKIEMEKKRQFQVGRFIEVPERIVYGWTNMKEFRISNLLHKKCNYYSNFQFIQHYQQRITEKFANQKNEYLSQKPTLKNVKILKNIYDISAITLSTPDEHLLACGLVNGCVTVWSINSANVIYNTDKHSGSVTALEFFEGWKLISGSSRGEVQIDNILKLAVQMKRTNIFQSNVDYPITNIKISSLGIAFVLDTNSNVRVFDLWRNEKIAKIHSCNNFALLENRGKRWIASNDQQITGLYTNNDFTVILSCNWPNYNSRQLEQSEDKRNQVKVLEQNPWKCKGINVHVVRNFQFLLHLFDGLQNTYKKGYERKKIENLFTNLEFAQLYDRNFDIPDFGVTNNFKKGEKATEVGFGTSSKSYVSSSKSRGKNMKETSSINHVKMNKLTNAVLHPQKFLLERRKIDKPEVMTEQKLKSSTRQTYKKQGTLQNNLNNDLSKSLF